MPAEPARPLLDVDHLSELEAVWGRPWGAQSNIDKLRMVVVGGSQNSSEFWELAAGAPIDARATQKKCGSNMKVSSRF
jgi:hypothetical protein